MKVCLTRNNSILTGKFDGAYIVKTNKMVFRLNMKKIVLLAFVSVLLSTAVFVEFVRPVEASGTIYIRADGNVDPSTAPIQRNGDLYTLTDNITSDADGIVIERNSMTLDGVGYVLRGAGVSGSRGVCLSGISNVTITNIEVKAFHWGIYLSGSSNNSIVGNNVTNNDNDGIRLRDVSSSNIIYRNKITNNGNGIVLDYGSNNSVSGNNITNNRGDGIRVYGDSTRNSISENDITANRVGIYFYGGEYNEVYENNITNSNYCGIWIMNSYNNKIYRNNFIDNKAQVAFNIPSQPVNTWDNGYPLGGNYWSHYSGLDEKSGPNQDQLGSDGIGDTPYILDVRNRDRYPLMNICRAWVTTLISISTSSPSTLLGFTVNITGTLSDSYGNPLVNKTVVLQYTFPGVYTWVPLTSNITDSLGHFSVVWVPTATGYFTIKAEWAGNTTHYLASNSVTLSTIPHENRYVFSVESNSTISALGFNTTSRELGFNASGPSGTRGYVKITIAKTLVENIADVRVYLNGGQLNYTSISLDDSWQLYFTYLHSTHKVTITLGGISAPFIETPLGKVVIYGIPLTAIGIIIVLYVLKKKQKSH